MNSERECVIVGGGLAGLATAYGLRDRRCLLLEREGRVGGRVLSVRTEHGTLDLGACFAVGADVFPDEAAAVLPTPRMPERGPIRYRDKDRAVEGESAWECIAQLALPPESMRALESFRDGTRDAGSLPDDARRVLDAFFKQVHPGRVEDYIPERQRDALAPLYPDHYPRGNGCAVEAYEAVLAAEDVVRGALVTRIDEDRDGVTVSFGHGSRAIESVRAKFAVVATPGDVARSLVAPTEPGCAQLLANLHYGTYTAVGLVVDAQTLARFRYLLSPDCPLNVVIQQAGADPRYRSLLCYYSDPFAETIAALTDAEIVATTVAHLASLDVRIDRVCESAVRRWHAVGTVISPAYAQAKRACDGRATARVFLAGDYLSTDPAWGYGTVDAVASGRRAAALVKAALG